jgi:rsbT co-antagonist protein RsbR
MAPDLSGLDAGVASCEAELGTIRDLVSQIVRDQLAPAATPSDTANRPDAVLIDLARIREALQARRSEALETERRLGAVMEMMVAMAALDFSKSLQVGDDGGILDAVATAANLLSEELNASVVSKAYIDNILESMIDPLIVVEPNATIRTINRVALELSGRQKGELLRRPLGVLFVDEDIEQMVDQVLAQNVLRNAEKVYRGKDGRNIPVSFSASTMRDAAGSVQAIVCVARDITERKQAEQARRQSEMQEGIIRAQSVLLAELSTPLIPLSDQVMVMPLIGTLDTFRVHQVLESLLSGVASSGAEVAILDITGVSVVDTQVAIALIRAAQAVKLLGARVILTGIRPEVAQTLVGLNIDLSGIATHSSLQSGIAAVMGRR